MTETSKGMMEKSYLCSALSLPVVMIVFLGVAVLVEPEALIPALITGGFLLLMMGNFLRKKGKRSQDE